MSITDRNNHPIQPTTPRPRAGALLTAFAVGVCGGAGKGVGHLLVDPAGWGWVFDRLPW